MRNQLERAKDFCEDVVSSLDNECDGVINIDDSDVKTMNWLIEQAERAEIYKKALMRIGAKHEPPSSRVANKALFIADYHRNDDVYSI